MKNLGTTKSQLAAMYYLAKVKPDRYVLKHGGKVIRFLDLDVFHPAKFPHVCVVLTYYFYGDRFSGEWV